MSRVIIFNKPYGVISQFSPNPPHLTLKDYIAIPDVYPAGRLDVDSEGLLILTDDGKLQAQISNPEYRKQKTYWVQVEGIPTVSQLGWLANGVDLGDFVTLPSMVELIDEPFGLWPRIPPIRERKTIPTSWIKLSIHEGKNRQVRRMTAKVGLPTLRLIRSEIGGIKLADLLPGKWQQLSHPEFMRFFNNS